MCVQQVTSTRCGVLWLGAYERGEPVPDVSEDETLILEVPGAFFADLLAGHHLTADHKSLVPYKITGGSILPHGRVTITVRIVGEVVDFVEIMDDQVVACSEGTLDLLAPNLTGDDRFLALVGDRFVTLQCVNREPAAAPSWSWTPTDCQWWVGRFAVSDAAGCLGSG